MCDLTPDCTPSPRGSLSAYLDQQETNSQRSPGLHLNDYDTPRDDYRVQPVAPLEASFRHSGWHHNRHKVWQALKECGSTANRLDRFANCGSCCRVMYSPSLKQAWTVANYCRDKFCSPCAVARSRLIARTLAGLCKGKQVRFITLTMKHNDNPLLEQVKRLYASFLLLRRRDAWKRHVVGGAAFLEVKIGDDNKWHPHLHILCEGGYFEQTNLSREWLMVTGDSHIVDIRRPGNEQELCNYVCKYASKPLGPTVYKQPERLTEAVLAFKGIRTCNTFGTWRGTELEPDRETPPDAVQLGSVEDLLRDCRAGVEMAIIVLGLIKHHRFEVPDGPPEDYG